MTEQFDAVLIRARQLSETTMDFRFRRTDGLPVRFEPGEFYRFAFTDADGEFERPYSLCNFKDAADDEIDLVISRVENGRASRYLFASDLGVQTTISGPYGRLKLPTVAPARLFMVATSVGIAPFLPMLAPLTDMMGAGVEAKLLFGVRDRSEFLYRDELLAYSRARERFELALCYSREASPLEDYEFSGYVSAHIDRYHPDPDTDHFLVCGNPRMVDDCYGALKELGFKAGQVLREKYVYARQQSAGAKAGPTDEQRRLIAAKLEKHRPK